VLLPIVLLSLYAFYDAALQLETMGCEEDLIHTAEAS
jgi:hypothetical protein